MKDERKTLNEIISKLLEYRSNKYTMIIEYERNMMTGILDDLSKKDLQDNRINYLISTNSDSVIITLSKNMEV